MNAAGPNRAESASSAGPVLHSDGVRWRIFWNYALAVLLTGLAFAARMQLTGRSLPPYILPYPTVILVAVLAGFGPALVSTVMLVALSAIWLIPVDRQLHPPEHVLNLVLFAFVGLLISGLGGLYRRARISLLEKEKEQAVRESEESLRTVFQTNPDATNVNRISDGTFLMVNDSFLRATGWAPEEVIGRSSLDLHVWADPKDRARMVELLRAKGVVQNFEAPFCTKDGQIRHGLMSAATIVMSGEPVILSITRDITDWKRAEEERARLSERVQESQRLESLGRLAGGVAHDFNNLLTVILSCSEGLKADLEKGSRASPEDVEQIWAGAVRARDLTRQLLAFARRQVILPVSLDLNDVLGRSEKLMRRVLGEDIQLVVRADPELWWVLCDPSQFEQILLNLAVNARDAMPRGGTMTIEAHNGRGDGAESPGVADGCTGRWVRVLVRDSGVGMTPEVKAHLFEPFFTTKDRGKGTGLGLATVHGIVAQSGGHIHVQSELGRGTTFEICLPRTMEPPVASVTRPATPSGTGTESILVIEDDPQVRYVTSRALQGAGYRVVLASGGSEALELVIRLPDPLDLIVTDVVMPGMSGQEIVAELRRRQPGLRALYVSGYADEAIWARGALDAESHLLSKPFTARSLLQRVREALDARP